MKGQFQDILNDEFGDKRMDIGLFGLLAMVQHPNWYVGALNFKL